MVYILAQRLQAQNVPLDKSKRVLQDVIRTMYNPMFIAELFRPQDVYSMQSTRQIFDRLAHSSIMRLNESSMDKLFDLMTMGFKYQLLACSYPQELLHVTLNHLYQLRAKIEESEQVAELVDDVIRLTNEKYAAMTPFDYAGLKQTLCRFFADKRVKVSLFLQDGMQKNDGTLTLHYAGPLPPGAQMPGQITYFDVSGASVGTDGFGFPSVDTIEDPGLGIAGSEPRQAACALGLNLYSKEVAAPPPHHAAATAAAAAAAADQHQVLSRSQPKLDSAAAERAILAEESNARQDLNLLADLIGPRAGGAGDNFKLNLFPETGMPGGAGSVGGVAGTQTIVIDVRRDMQTSNRALMGVMDDMRLDGGGGGGPPPTTTRTTCSA